MFSFSSAIILPPRRVLFLSVFLPLASGATAEPVSNPNGSVTGKLGEVFFDQPALCERAPFVTARTHGPESQPAFDAALIPNGIGSIEVRSETHSVQFGTSIGEVNFPLSIEGDVDSVEFSVVIDCPTKFSDYARTRRGAACQNTGFTLIGKASA